MPTALASSPENGEFKTVQDELLYYKAQYEHLENELLEFQASSRELEAELEKDIEASEKREHTLKKSVETLRYEVEEWKNKHKQAKTESNLAQANLQKEVTALRDTNRNLQLRLRDVEVVNDDYERSARNTTSSLEDMESKYNVALERSVLLEGEMKTGEQEREKLRIETQRLRDELSDMSVETDIVLEKLRIAEGKVRRNTAHGQTQMSGLRLQEPDATSVAPSTPSTTKSPMPKSGASTALSDSTAPPSPTTTTTTTTTTTGCTDATVGPSGLHGPPQKLLTRRESNLKLNTLRKAPSRSSFLQPPSLAIAHDSGVTMRPPRESIRRESGTTGEGRTHLARSASLYQVRGLLGKMQKLEERVNAVKSKLPAPADTPPQPYLGGAEAATTDDSASSTVRTTKRRISGDPVQTSIIPSGITIAAANRLKPRPSRVSLAPAKVQAHAPILGSAQGERVASKVSPPHLPAKSVKSPDIKRKPEADTTKQISSATRRLPRMSLGAPNARPARLSESGPLQGPQELRNTRTGLAPRRTVEEEASAARLPTTRSPARRQSRGEIRGPPALGVSLLRRNVLPPQTPAFLQSGLQNAPQRSPGRDSATVDLGETF